MTTPARGAWGELSIHAADFVKNIRGPASTVSETFGAILEEANLVLKWAKSFSVSYIDPLAAAISALEVEIKGLIDDLRQFGLYITGDWSLLVDSFENLKGGYEAYESRMLTRLTDKSDPTRPDLSPHSELFSLFFFLSAPGYEIHKIISFLNGLQRLFHLDFAPTGTAFPTPAINGFAYAANATDVLNFKSLEQTVSMSATPKLVKIKWTVPQAQLKPTYMAIPPVGFTGFMVSISTTPEGIDLVWDRPKADVVKDEDPQKREYGKLLDQTGKPITLFGGGSEIAIPSHNWKYSYNESFEGTKIKTGRSRIYGIKDPNGKREILPLELLYQDQKYYFQKTYYVKSGVLDPQFFKNGYSITVPFTDFPLDADINVTNGIVSLTNPRKAPVYYVRVASTSAEVVDTQFRYDLSVTLVETGKDVTASLVSGDGPQARSHWSGVGKMTPPAQETNLFLQSLYAALEILILCRVDLPVADELEHIKGNTLLERTIALGVAKERTGLERFRDLARQIDVTDLYRASGQSPLVFRRRLYTEIKKLAYSLVSRGHISPEMQAFVINNTKTLRALSLKKLLANTPIFKVNDTKGEFSLLDAMAQERFSNLEGQPTTAEALPATQMEWGIAANPLSIGLISDDSPKVFRLANLVTNRSPQYYEPPIINSVVQKIVTAAEAPSVLKAASPAMRIFYEKYRQSDGTIILPQGVVHYLETLNETNVGGSDDLYPVFYTGRSNIMGAKLGTPKVDGAIVYCRSILTEYDNGVLITEAATALGAFAMTAPVKDGRWLNIRFTDAFPEMGDLTTELLNWVGSLSSAVSSVGDVTDAYLDFIQARVDELQAMAIRIDNLLKLVVDVKFNFPLIAGLRLVSKGTDGLIQDFLNAKNKPITDPLDYGAGVCIVAPFIPPLLDSIFPITVEHQKSSTSLDGLFDVDAIPVIALPGPDDPPDPL